ncbi:MAG: HhH-GPD family protein, partial [Candidatus Kaiserbacteria bacterium GW2011_GWC2_49_12]
MPHLYNELVELPGVGDYTAKAVRVFAWNKPEILIETNIRTAFIYHFFRSQISDGRLKFGNGKVRDSEIFSIA